MIWHRSLADCSGRLPRPRKGRGVHVVPWIGFAVVLVVCFGSCTKTDDASTASLIRIADAQFRSRVLLLSEVSGSNPLEHEFSIENVAGRPLRVTVERVSCGCLGLRLREEGRPIKAKEHFALEIDEVKHVVVRFRLAAKPEVQTQNARFLARQDDGRQERFGVSLLVPVRHNIKVRPPVISCRVSSDDPNQTERSLRIECAIRGKQPREVEPRLLVVPPEIEVVE